jgi:hypothetical protein
MPTILRDLPFFPEKPEDVEFDGRRISTKPDQIMVWVGITEGEQTDFDPRRPWFPAILDPGFSHNSSIRHEHLIRWAGLDPRWLKQERAVRINDELVPLYEADVWLHPNVPGKRDRAAGGEPFRLALDTGIAIYPPTMSSAPRLPLLGLRALRLARLHLTIDCDRCSVTLRTARRFWFF